MHKQTKTKERREKNIQKRRKIKNALKIANEKMGTNEGVCKLWSTWRIKKAKYLMKDSVNAIEKKCDEMSRLNLESISHNARKISVYICIAQNEIGVETNKKKKMEDD